MIYLRLLAKAALAPHPSTAYDTAWVAISWASSMMSLPTSPSTGHFASASFLDGPREPEFLRYEDRLPPPLLRIAISLYVE